MYCSKCGAQIPDDSAFCKSCGTSISCKVAENQGQQTLHSIPSQQKGSRDFTLTKDQVFNTALQAVQKLRYKISSIDKVNGLLQFKTQMSWRSWAGQDMSVLILDNGNGTCTVQITGARNVLGGFTQVIDWGEVNSVAGKVFREMDKLLGK